MSSKIKGVVVRNVGRGRKLGYPTANIEVDADVDEGLFVGWTQVGSRKFPSIIFIGAPQTFQESHKRLESYILDFSEDIYGQEIEVEIIRKIRDNRKFEDSQALVVQMKRDEEVARKFFAEYNENN